MLNRRGFTLIETMVVIVVMGLTLMLGFPRLRSAMVNSNVRGARNTVAALHSRARAAAVERSRATALWFNGSRVAVVATPRQVALAGSTHDTLGAVVDLNAEYGVALTVAGDPIGFDPRGVGTNTNPATLQVEKYGHTATLTISPFGRLSQ